MYKEVNPSIDLHLPPGGGRYNIYVGIIPYQMKELNNNRGYHVYVCTNIYYNVKLEHNIRYRIREGNGRRDRMGEEGEVQ